MTDMEFTLYDYALSGNCYKIRLFASILGVDYEKISVEFHPSADHKSEAMLQVSSAGTLPILKTDEMVLSETQAMLFWMAKKFDRSGMWWPKDDNPVAQAFVLQWLGFSGDLTATIGQARLNSLFQTPIDKDKIIKASVVALRRLEAHLTEQSFEQKKFLAGVSPTIADLACFPYVALSGDVGAGFGLEHDNYPAIRNWIYEIKSLPGFIAMPGIFEMHQLKDHEIDPAERFRAKG
ncbi:MAG: glutathione S-transferase family protein [Paracoccaceae bacterium]